MLVMAQSALPSFTFFASCAKRSDSFVSFADAIVGDTLTMRTVLLPLGLSFQLLAQSERLARHGVTVGHGLVRVDEVHGIDATDKLPVVNFPCDLGRLLARFHKVRLELGLLL